MKEYLYAIFISHYNKGYEEIDFQIPDDDEPINVCCGNSDPNNDSFFDYFIIHTFKGRAFLFFHEADNNIFNNFGSITDENTYVDHVTCSHNYILISSGKQMILYFFNQQKACVTESKRFTLQSPVLSMKPAATNTIAIFVQLQNYSLKMIREYNNELIDIDSNVLLYDVSIDSIWFIKNDLSSQIIDFKFEAKGETLKSTPPNKIKKLPYHIYFHKYDENTIQTIEELTQGEIVLNKTSIKFSKLISRQNKLLCCDEECTKLYFLGDNPFFEIKDQIILFDLFSSLNDFLVIIRHCNFGFQPSFQKPYQTSGIEKILESIVIETGEMNIPFSNFYDTNIFLELILMLLDSIQDFNIFREKAQNFLQIIYWILDYQSSLTDTFLLSRIITYQFFDIILDAFHLYFSVNIAVSPISLSCLSILIDKGMQVAPCKPSQKMFYLMRTKSIEDRPIIPIIPPIRLQFNKIHHMSMDFIQLMPEFFAKQTLSALLSCLKYTKCSVLFFAKLCFKLNIIQKVDESVYYLVKNLLIEANTIKNENLPILIKLLLQSYKFIYPIEPNSEILKKIRDFFNHKPFDLDNATMKNIQIVFDKYMRKLKPQFQDFLNKIRFYPQKDIKDEIHKFIISHIPIPITDTDTDYKFREGIEKLAKSGKVLRIKIEFINMIQDADDYVTLSQVTSLVRKRVIF